MSIEILSHRGYWKTIEQKNKKLAFERSFAMSFGTETDIRDMCGELVISHDPPHGALMTVEELLTEYTNHGMGLTLALNIKADGLNKRLHELLKRNSIQNYFVFDMSIPDMVTYLDAGMKVFTRQSDFETVPVLLDQAVGVWLDGFLDEWFSEEVILEHLDSGKKVCIVSPELHGRDHQVFWRNLRQMTVSSSKSVMLCTDYPELARKFFNEQD